MSERNRRCSRCREIKYYALPDGLCDSCARLEELEAKSLADALAAWYGDDLREPPTDEQPGGTEGV